MTSPMIPFEAVEAARAYLETLRIWVSPSEMEAALEAAALSAAGFGLVADAKAEALEESASDHQLRLSGHSGISITRLRTRAANLRNQS